MGKKKKIVTNNRELYEKFNKLNFSREVILKNVKPVQLNRIFANVNKEIKILKYEKIGDQFVIKKLKPLNFDIYFNNNTFK